MSSRRPHARETNVPLDEGKIQTLPFATSPFGKNVQEKDGNLAQLPHNLRHIETKLADEVPWSDLLLEISMTTAFASLTDGSPVSDGPSVASYVSFFALVWWIWASQVAYNMRFRQADTIHRIFVFCQLLVFAGLAAFTDNFDITQLTVDTPPQPNYDNKSEFLATQHRKRGVSIANQRGISLILGLSRLLLFTQYTIVTFHAWQYGLKLKSFGIHMAALAVSIVCYFVAYAILEGTSEGRAIAKIFLWYFPIVLEVASHYIASLAPGHVEYPPETVSKRSATVFIIVLGGGLDKITAGLRILVGNGGIHSAPWGLLICSALIFISEFSLYFKSPTDGNIRSLRALSWFFSHFFYLAALIVMLQGINSQLTFGRLGEGFNQITTALEPWREFILANPGTNLSTTTSDWPDAQSLYLTNGWSLSDDINGINGGIYDGLQNDDSDEGYNTWSQYYVNDLWSEMDLFKVTPSSNLLEHLYWFIYVADPSDSQQINATTTGRITNLIWEDQTASSTWFFVAAGLTLVTLACMNMIGRWPRDRWYWILWTSRMVFGITLILLAGVDVGSTSSEYNDDDQYVPTVYWNLVDKFLILVIVAVLLVAEQIIELIAIILASRSNSSLVRRVSSARFAPQLFSEDEPYNFGTLRDEPLDMSAIVETSRPTFPREYSERPLSDITDMDIKA